MPGEASSPAAFPYEAVLFDLDGVLTSTSDVHAASWKQTFECLLGEPFDIERDYLEHVDGKSRGDGARDFLRSRGLDAPPERVHKIGEYKQALVDRALAAGEIDAYPGALRWIAHLHGAGVRTGVVSSSANCDAVLEAAGIAELFELTIDGHDVVQLGLAGKPAPDAFLEASARMQVPPGSAVVVEDALAGVAAGRAGGFGRVIGVARGATPAALRLAGADVVVHDLAELIP